MNTHRGYFFERQLSAVLLTFISLISANCERRHLADPGPTSPGLRFPDTGH